MVKLQLIIRNLEDIFLKYNWDGNLLHQYKFDMGLRSLAVDEATGTIFFVGYVNDEMKLFFGNL